MRISRPLALALITSTGAVGVFLGRALPHDAPIIQSPPSEPLLPSIAAPPGDDCKVERAELASTKTQLTICTAFMTGALDTKPSNVPEEAKPNAPKLEPEEIQRNRELLEDDSEVVIVRRVDGTIGLYPPDELPNGADRLIIGRKFPDGKLGWYSRPVSGPLPDPAASGRRAPPMFVGSNIRLHPDGTITVHGKPAPPAVQRMLGGKVDEPAKP